MANMQVDAGKNGIQEAIQYLRVEMQQIEAELRDLAAKISQSRSQVDQVTQRNAIVVGEIHRIESSPNAFSNEEVMEVYRQALDVQQRMLTARGQLERLQTQESIASGMTDIMRSIIDQISMAETARDSASFNAREMIIQVIDAQEEQSERLARQMHDGPAHSLTNFILQAEICQKLYDKNPEKAREELKNLKDAAGNAFQKVRGFIFDLRPMMLSDLGLVPTLKRYLEGFSTKTGIEAEFEMIGRQRRIEHYREVLIFRGVQALIQNARDQSAATFVKVTVEMNDQRVRAVVENNGQALGTGKLSLNANNSEALGLGALQERVNLVGGLLKLDSVPGRGSKIEIDIPAGPEVQNVGVGE